MTKPLEISLQLLQPNAQPPAFAHPGDAGADLYSAADLVLAPGERALVPTGIAVAIPQGYVGLVLPRSGWAARHGISIVNAPGAVDAGYRGEVMVNLVNLDPHTSVTIGTGDRIAQLVVQRVPAVRFVAVEELPGSPRGAAGHGSSGR